MSSDCASYQRLVSSKEERWMHHLVSPYESATVKRTHIFRRVGTMPVCFIDFSTPLFIALDCICDYYAVQSALTVAAFCHVRDLRLPSISRQDDFQHLTELQPISVWVDGRLRIRIKNKKTDP